MSFVRSFRALDSRSKGALIGFFVIIGLILTAFGGWVANIVKFVDMATSNAEVGVLFIARAVGMIFMPLGAILGFF